MRGNESINSMSLKYGGMTGIGLIIYFLLMKVLGLTHVLELRFFNFVILVVGVLFAIRHYRTVSNGLVDYLEGFGMGFLTSLISSAIFSSFLYIYLRVLDPSFMTYLIQNAPLGSYLTPFAASFAIMIEATASGSVITLLGLQYSRKVLVMRNHA